MGNVLPMVFIALAPIGVVLGIIYIAIQWAKGPPKE
jgi:hypothetical protein